MSHEIRCSNFELRINDLLDAREDPSTDTCLINHADLCAQCKSVFDDYLALDDSLSNVVWDTPTLARLSAPTPQARPYGVWRSFALAAALMIALTIAFYSFESGHRGTVVNLNGMATLDQPPTGFEIEQTLPSKNQSTSQGAVLGSSIKAKDNVPVSWNEISERLQPVLNPYYQISAELPGIRPIQSSLYLTIDWVQEKILKLSPSREQNRSFGHFLRLRVPIA